MYCTHVPGAVQPPSYASTAACSGPSAAEAKPARGEVAQITVDCFFTSCVILELDLELCTPRDVVCHLVSEGSLPREGATGAPLHLGLALGDSLLPVDVVLARSGVVDGAKLVISPRMVV